MDSVITETSKASGIVQAINQNLNSFSQTLGQVRKVSEDLHSDTRRVVERFELLLGSGQKES